MLFFILWAIGAIISYLISKYYNWQYNILNDDGAEIIMLPFTLFWMIGLPLVMLLICGEKISKIGRNRREKVEYKNRIRIAQNNQIEALLKESEVEVDRYLESIQCGKPCDKM